jgi:hypothetical protein
MKNFIIKKKTLIQNIICLCTAKEINVWKISAEQILKNIKSNKYTLIVPNTDLSFF